jgi:hypothetical protein
MVSYLFDAEFGLAYLFRYGLGTCYLRMSKIRLAEYHYRKAVEIHPKNAVLLGCVGMVCLQSYSHTQFFGDEELTFPLYDFLRLSNDVVIENQLLPFSMKPFSLLLRTHWSVIGERKFSSRCGNTK